MNPNTSRCPNAAACALWDQYGPDCERGEVLQKCFVSIHRELGVLQFLVRAAASPAALEQANQRLRAQPETPAPQPGS